MEARRLRLRQAVRTGHVDISDVSCSTNEQTTNTQLSTGARLQHDNLTIMSKLRSTYDERLIYQIS